MKALKHLCQNTIVSRAEHSVLSMATEFIYSRGSSRAQSTSSSSEEEPEMNDFREFMESLKNYEKSGVPKGAGTDSDEGFDLGRMRRLMDQLDNPLSNFKAIHITGTKGKGSTAAFISSILRAEGYSVGCYTSPHIRTIRERMSLGKSGEPVSAKTLNCIFHQVKERIIKAIELKNGGISHFEVLTAIAFKVFSQEKVDIAVIEAGLGGARDATNVISSSELVTSVITTIGEEHLAALGGSLESIAMAKSGIIKHKCPVVFGGPFLPLIEQILRDKASLMSSHVISAFDSGRGSKIKGFSLHDGRPFQACDIVIARDAEPKQPFELFDVKLYMLGSHQLQNAVTATCTALCLRDMGWRVSDGSIRAGLENTCLLGRSQFLSSVEAEGLGISKSTVLLDGAHTRDSAKALVDTINMAFPRARLALVVAMASDKDHLGFAHEFLSGGQVEAVFLTEVNIAGAKSRTTQSSLLLDCWIQSAKDLGIGTIHEEMAEYQEVFKNKFESYSRVLESKTIFAYGESILSSMKLADRFFKGKKGNEQCIIVVTGSLHIVSSVLSIHHS